MSIPQAEPVRVVAAVIENSEKDILIALRPGHRHQGGKWEFPGGKIEAGENSRDALTRELAEELGIVVTDAVPLIRVPYRYPGKDILLEVWRVIRFQGVPAGKEGQPVRWIAPGDLTAVEFPPANRAIVAALLYPDIYGISDARRYGETGFLARLEHALEQGLRLLQLRAAVELGADSTGPRGRIAILTVARQDKPVVINVTGNPGIVDIRNIDIVGAVAGHGVVRHKGRFGKQGVLEGCAKLLISVKVCYIYIAGAIDIQDSGIRLAGIDNLHAAHAQQIKR